MADGAAYNAWLEAVAAKAYEIASERDPKVVVPDDAAARLKNDVRTLDAMLCAMQRVPLPDLG